MGRTLGSEHWGHRLGRTLGGGTLGTPTDLPDMGILVKRVKGSDPVYGLPELEKLL